MFVPGAQTQAEVGDAKSICRSVNGFGFFMDWLKKMRIILILES
jgi:hypothetical protein